MHLGIEQVDVIAALGVRANAMSTCLQLQHSVFMAAHKRGQQVAGEMECRFLQWENRSTEDYDVLINCTSVGMHPKVDETPFPVPTAISNNMLCVKAIFGIP